MGDRIKKMSGKNESFIFFKCNCFIKYLSVSQPTILFYLDKFYEQYPQFYYVKNTIEEYLNSWIESKNNWINKWNSWNHIFNNIFYYSFCYYCPTVQIDNVNRLSAYSGEKIYILKKYISSKNIYTQKIISSFILYQFLFSTMMYDIQIIRFWIKLWFW